MIKCYSYVFECVDPVNDPHIIKYDKPKVVLLEVFKNQLKEEHVDWKTLNEISNRLCVPCKSQQLRFYNWEEFDERVLQHNGGRLGVEKPKKVPKTDRIIVEDNHEAIVSKDDFDRAQAIINIRKPLAICIPHTIIIFLAVNTA